MEAFEIGAACFALLVVLPSLEIGIILLMLLFTFPPRGGEEVRGSSLKMLLNREVQLV